MTVSAMATVVAVCVKPIRPAMREQTDFRNKGCMSARPKTDSYDSNQCEKPGCFSTLSLSIGSWATPSGTLESKTRF